MAQPKCDGIGEGQGLEGGTENMILPITCGQTKAEFYVSKMRSGKTVGKCILFQSKWISPTEFENLSGIHSAKKWRRSIKYNGEPIGEWLANAQQDHAASSNPDKQDKQKPQELLQESQTQLDQSLPLSQNLHEVYTESPVPGPGASVSTHISDSAEDGPHNGQLWRMIDKLCARIDGLSQEMRDQDTRHKNLTKDLRKKIQEQSERITHLENQVEAQSLTTPPIPSEPNIPTTENHMASLRAKVETISATLSNQQKLLELTERSNRAKNVVIMGLDEPEGEEIVNERVASLFAEKLGLSNISIPSSKRLGKRSVPHGTRPRPVLVALDSTSTKKQIMSNRAKLAGTKIYLNNDLTKAQQEEEKKLRATRKQLMELPDFRGKRITISSGKLFADRHPIDADLIGDLLPSN